MTEEESIVCPKCNSEHVIKRGTTLNKTGTLQKQQYFCSQCGKRFSARKVLREEPEFVYSPKPIPSQNWEAYSKAQNKEKLMLMQMLSEISDILQIEDLHRVGRPRADLYEMIFCIAMKTYTRLSSRRLISDLEIANKLHYISRVPHFTTVMKYYDEEEVTPLLLELIKLSALPLKQVETEFAVDSSGFSTSVFGRWFDHKWGKEKDRRQFLKGHVMIGVKTNIITSIEITDSNGADCPLFTPLVKSTARHFKIKEVSADKAYSSRENFETVESLGGMPYIPFKSNATGKARGKTHLWGTMFREFKERKQEFNEHYHKRSNVESTFNMIKAKLGSNLMTKKFNAQKNELLAKALIHNLLVLIQESFEQNLNIDLSTEATNLPQIKAMR